MMDYNQCLAMIVFGFGVCRVRLHPVCLGVLHAGRLHSTVGSARLDMRIWPTTAGQEYSHLG